MVAPASIVIWLAALLTSAVAQADALGSADASVDRAPFGSISTFAPPSSFTTAARARGTPDIPGLNIVWLTPWIDVVHARAWKAIVVHQSEGPAGSALRNAMAQAAKPRRRGATIWVETDGTVYWAVAEFAAPIHIRHGNRNDGKYIDNSQTYRQVLNDDTLGVEFVGNYPKVRRPVTPAQVEAWRILVRVLQVRYGIDAERIYAHNWIDHKDRRYCEGCELATMARAQAGIGATASDRSATMTATVAAPPAQ